MKKNMLAVGILITFGMLSCTDETATINENIEVENVVDKIDEVINRDSTIVVEDTIENVQPVSHTEPVFHEKENE
jgi:hypothetical protein